VREEGDAVAKPTRLLAVGLMAVVVSLATEPCDAMQEQGLGTRVRAEDPVLAALIQRATDQSPTFRRLVDAIHATDGIVYVIRGRCGHFVQACLKLWMGAAGSNRVLHVVVDERKLDMEAMASIGHELKHALEVLAEPSVRTGPGMLALYKQNGATRGETFETKAATEAGNAVYKELKRKSRQGVSQSQP
jgi:hypothetical protein